MWECFTERTRRCLEAAAWDPGRRLDTTECERAFKTMGVFVSSAAMDFLSRFGELAIRYPHFRDPTREDGCHFYAQRAAANLGPLGIAEYEGALKRRLTVVGEAFDEHCTLMMDERGAVFSAFEDFLFKMGDSGIDALNGLCEGREGEDIDYTRGVLPLDLAPATLGATAMTNLFAGGWHGGQTHDVAGLDRDLQTLSERPPKAAVDFLREFHGVRMACTTWKAQGDLIAGDQYRAEQFCLFTAQAVSSLPASHFPEYRRRLGQSVAAIGQLEASGFVLLMTDDGRVLAGMRQLPDILWLVGHSGYDAINNMCAGTPWERFI